MKKFTEWLEENHPEAVDEGWKTAAAVGVLGGVVGSGLYQGGKSMMQPTEPKAPASHVRSLDDKGAPPKMGSRAANWSQRQGAKFHSDREDKKIDDKKITIQDPNED